VSDLRLKELGFLLKHSSIYGIGTILSQAVSFLLLPLYTRYLTPADYGVLELLDTTNGLIGIVVGLGVSSAVSRFYYEKQSDRERATLVSTAFVLVAAGSTVLLWAIALFSEALAALILDGPEQGIYFQVAFVGLFVGIVADVGRSYLQMIYKSTLVVSLSITQLVLSVVLNVWFVAYLNLGILGILYTTVIVRLLVGLPVIGAILYRTGVSFSLSDAKDIFRYSVPLLPATLGTAVMNYSDRYFVKHFVSLGDTGVYVLAKKIGTVLHSLVTGPFISTFVPRRFQLAETTADAPGIFATIFDTFFILLLSCSLVLAMLAPEIMVVMTTPAFYGASQYVAPFLLTMLIFGLKYHVDFGILYRKKTHQYAYVNTITVVVQLTGAFFLIRAFGVWGAVAAQLLSTVVNFVLLYVLSQRLYPIPFDLARAAKAFGVALFFYGVSRYVVFDHLAMALSAKGILIAVYCAALWMTGLVSLAAFARLPGFTRSSPSALS
jgi:O-antigen/teichoic acid export membrane protein